METKTHLGTAPGATERRMTGTRSNGAAMSGATTIQNRRYS